MRKIKLGLVLALGLACAACGKTTDSGGPEPEPLPVSFCDVAPLKCAEACQDCSDPEACMENGGECAAGDRAAATLFYIDDATDGGLDIWTGGCHYKYPDAACTLAPAFHMGDLCGEENKDALVEWTDAQCHGPKGDTEVFNCDRECKKRGMGGGTCVVLPGHCGAGRDSARCQCDPNPT